MQRTKEQDEIQSNNINLQDIMFFFTLCNKMQQSPSKFNGKMKEDKCLMFDVYQVIPY